jgi:hypothetical protein
MLLPTFLLIFTAISDNIAYVRHRLKTLKIDAYMVENLIRTSHGLVTKESCQCMNAQPQTATHNT